uniref:RRM domain-containing protein n=1 Tax=Setaria italica TaxID=4555 RepID=K3ZXL8_SETIT
MMARGRRGPGGPGRYAGGQRGDERPYRHGARVDEVPCTTPPRRASGWGVAPPSRHLWVGGLAPGVTASDLSELFLRCGDVEGIARDPGRNFAFVSFRREGDAVAAVRGLQGARLAGAPVRIEFSKGVSVEHSLFIIICVCFLASKISSVRLTKFLRQAEH